MSRQNIRRDVLRAEPVVEVDERIGEVAPPHDYHSGRCINCGTDWIDEDMYGPFECKPHPPLLFTTSTGDRCDPGPTPAEL